VPDEQTADQKPPYISFTTLLAFLDRLGAGPIPPRIDRSAMDSYSGGTQGILLATLRALNFIDPDGNVRSDLIDAARDEVARKAYFTDFARRVYPEQLDLAERSGTAQMLHETFTAIGYQGSTLRKAVVFYLALVEYTGLPTSPHFRPPRQQAPRRRKASAPPPEVSVPAGADAPSRGAAAPAGDTTVITIGNMATITVTVDAQWLRLPVETLTGIRQAVADLEALATSLPAGDDHRPDGEGSE
jgi:hypothetical protein